jgi:hypothetical protein
VQEINGATNLTMRMDQGYNLESSAHNERTATPFDATKLVLDLKNTQRTPTLSIIIQLTFKFLERSTAEFSIESVSPFYRSASSLHNSRPISTRQEMNLS